MADSSSTILPQNISASTGTNPLEDPSSPYFLHHSENDSSVIVSPELTSMNFASRKRSFLLAVSIRNKQGFLDGSIPKPAPESSLYLPWIRCNNLMVAWLLRSISTSIASTVIYMEEASQIWEKLNQRFSQPDDSRICHLQHLLCSVTQGTKTVDEYFTELNGIWEELRSFRPLPHCSCGKCNQGCFQVYADLQQKDHVFKFLNGLNESFSALRSQIILMKPFPTLDQTYNMILREENQRTIHLLSQTLSDAAIMAVRKRKSDLLCTHCGKPGHLKEQCYRLIKSSIFVPAFTSASSSTGFAFGASSASNSTTSTTSMMFGSSNAFAFNSTAASTPSQPGFGNPSSAFTFAPSPSGNNDQMNMEDSMAEDTVQATTSTIQQPVAPLSPAFIFGSTGSSGANQFCSTTPAGANPFQFGSQPNQVPPQNPSQASGSLEVNGGGSFSLDLGSFSPGKSNREFVRIRKFVRFRKTVRKK